MRIKKLLLFTALLLTIVCADKALAEDTETILSFRPVPPRRVALVQKLMVGFAASEARAESVTLSIERNVRYAEFDLDDDGANEIFLLYGHLPDIGTAGPPFEIWQRIGAAWRLIHEGSTDPGELRVSDKKTNGYRNLVTEHSISDKSLPNETQVERVIYRWDGHRYQGDGREQG